MDEDTKPEDEAPEPLDYDDVIPWDPEAHGSKRSNDSDPVGQVSIFEETGGGVPAFDTSSARRIFEYVDKKALSIGSYIPKNRGVPPNTDPNNMLSQEEKAIILLGRAVGIPYRLIYQRLNDLRSGAGKPLTTSDPHMMCAGTVGKHKEIVTAIQGDLLAAVEEWSPLVSGQQRFVWHARMVEMYREIIIRVSQEPANAIRRIGKKGQVRWLDKVDEIRRLDSAMQHHMGFFERLGTSGDLSAMLSNPSEKIREQQVIRAEHDIEELHEKGEIDDIERLKRLRALHHGADE